MGTVLSAALLFVSGFLQAAEEPAQQPTPKVQCSVQAPGGQWDSFSKFIGGIDRSPFLPAMTPDQKAAWNDFSRIAGSEWRSLHKRYLDHIDSWRSRSLGNTAPPQVAFYPFSGPDSPDMFAFFPDAQVYVMVGLEPVGCVPAAVSDYDEAYLTELRHSLEPVVALGFFRTNDMKQEFSQGNVNGVLPLLLFLLARDGYSIHNVTPITIGPTGQALPNATQPKGETDGIAIEFSDPRHGVRTLRYFSLNLENSRLRRKPGTVKFLQSMPEMGTLAKSASYLMHKSYFSSIRGLILAKSRVVVEDDSGIPLHFFDPAGWDVHLYGSYSEPIKLFKNWHQEDLKTAFSTRTDVQPLDFAIGYRNQQQSNLLLAVRRGK